MDVNCPECGENIQFRQEPLLREIIECAECGSQLVVTEVNPQLRVESSGEIGEDWGE